MFSATLANLLIKIILMAAIGYIMRKKGLMDDAFSKNISDLLLLVVVPLNILAVGNSTFDSQMAANMGIAAIVVAAYYSLGLLLAWLLARTLPLKAGLRGLFANLMILGNVGYIGFPIIAELFGDEGMLYAVVYNLGFQLIAFTVGIRLMGDSKISLRSFLTSPMTLAPLIAIALFVSPLRLPTAVVSTFELVGGMSAPISMFIIGGSLAKIKLSTLFTSGWGWLVFALRQLCIPAALAALLYAFGMQGLLPATLVVLTGMPSATINVIFSERYNTDPPFAIRAVVLGTALMVVSMPLLTLLSEWLFL